MANKRARISDRNPLTATDGVLAGYEQVNKSTSQVPEITPPQTERSTPDRPMKPASQQADKSTSQDELADPSVRFLGAIPTTSDQPASQQVNNLTSQQSDKSTSQPVSQLASQEVNNLASQQVNETELNKSTSQQVDQPASQIASNPTSQEVSILELDKLTSQQVDQSASQQSDNLASQQVNKPTIRKATFQVDAAILADLDRYHLQLQIEMGRRNAPYKEILVEEAIAQWLERAAKSPDRAVKSLIKRQEQR
jgi:hypothetical protein